MRASAALALMLAAAAQTPAPHALLAHQAQGLVLRGYEQPPPVRAVAADSAGVRVRAGDGRTVLVGWDRVLRVPGDLRDQAKPYADLATRAWRARARVERGDLVLAEPLLADLYERATPAHGPTRMVVCHGLLRAMLARGARAAAVEPWLAWVEAALPRQADLRFHGRDWADRAGLPAVIDPQTELCPLLPPAWLATPATSAVLTTSLPEDARDTVRTLAELYKAAARFELQGGPQALPDRPQDPAAQLVYDVVASRVLEADERSPARERLQRRLEGNNPPWTRAWLRLGVGRSLVIEDDRELRLRGVAYLLRVHVLDRSALPAVADMALAEAAVTLDRDGQGAQARELGRLLARVSPGTPALSWPPLAGLLDTPSPPDEAAPRPPATEGPPA